MAAMCSGQGDRQRAKMLLAEAGDIYQDLGDQWLGYTIMPEVAWENFRNGSPRKGRELMEGLLAFQRQANLKWNMLFYLNSLWYFTLYLGDYPSARAYADENLEIRQSVAIAIDEAGGLMDFGRLELALGNPAQARQKLETALKIYRKLQVNYWISRTLNYLGLAAIHEGNLENGIALLEESQQISADFERVDDEVKFDNSFYLGQAAQRQGDCTRAAALFRDSLQEIWISSVLPWIPGRLEALAASELGLKRYPFSATLLGAAEQQRQEMETPIFPVDRPAYEETLSSLQAALSIGEFNQAWEMGAAMNIDEIIAYALAANDE